MSRYDPQGIYSRPSSYTKTGQIIQKKPYKLQSALTQEEIPRSISVLRTFGYSVYSPGIPIFNQPHLFIPFTYYYPTVTVNHTFTLSNLYLNISDHLTSLKQIPLSSVQSSFVQIGISSVRFVAQSTDTPYNISPLVYSNGVSQYVPSIVISTSASYIIFFPLITSALLKNIAFMELEGQTSSVNNRNLEDQDTPYNSFSYISSNFLWSQFYSGTITDDMTLFSCHSALNSVQLTNYNISGFVYISLTL